MIYEVLVTNPSSEALPLTLTRPETSGLVVNGIEGLGPGKVNINVRENTLSSGGIFNSATTPPRNIVFTLQFLSAPTIEATRLRTYRYFPVESRIRLDFRTDAGTFYIYGYVESNEPTIFSKDEGAIISVICPDPFFYTYNGEISGSISEIANLLEFPFSNESLVEDTIIFGERFFQSENFIIPCDGTVNVGPTLTIRAEGGQVNNPVIYFKNPNDQTITESLSFLFTESLPQLEDGDYLEIVCERLNKSVRRYVASTETYLNYIGAVTMDSSWPILHPGDNIFSYDAEDGAAYIRFDYQYQLKYSGI